MIKSGYDWASGQAYTDRVVPSFVYPSDAKGAAWAHESPYLPPGWEEGSPVGANSLKHMAMRKTLLDQRPLTAAHFASVPWELANYLWDCLGRCGKRTLYMWKIFATAYPREFREIAALHSLKTPSKKIPLRDYFQLVKSPSLSWGTVVTIFTDHADLAGLVDVSKVTNIVALDIRSPPPPPPSRSKSKPIGAEDGPPIVRLTDRVVRSWGELALTGGAFKHLRTLTLRFQNETTPQIFAYLDHFPSLEVFIAVGCSLFTVVNAGILAKRYGWEVFEDDGKKTKITKKSAHELYTDHISDTTTVPNSERSMVTSLPLLEFSLGTPETRQPRGQIAVWFYRPLRDTNAGMPSRKRTAEPDPQKLPTIKKQRSKPIIKKSNKNVDMAGLLTEFQR
ncbi:hypothetical protein FQN55_007182 [Onygenales sp. PD_40]|nr:hypothetical protein FQN55_007182 [Onygenales sp. PD_40]